MRVCLTCHAPETAYVADLGALTTFYVRPLHAAIASGHAIVSQNDVRNVFSSIEVCVFACTHACMHASILYVYV
jgi:hypothetical protein